VLLKSNDELMTLVINSIRNDLVSTVDCGQTLALAAIANIGGNQLAETLSSDVQRLLVAHNTLPAVKKKAALCLLRLYRTNPDALVHEEWAPRFISLLEDRHLGVIISVMSLLLGLVSDNSDAYESIVPHATLLLSRLIMHKACTVDYLYYSTPSPWLQIKLLKLLQYFDCPQDATHKARLNECLKKILTKTDVTKSVNKNNADHAVLFEAVNLIIAHGDDADPKLRTQAITHLGRFISVREPNIRYLGLATMGKLAHLEDTCEVIKKHQSTILFSLKDADISVRRRALDLLFAMCDTENAIEIVRELVNYLAVSHVEIRDELVLKIAILAEMFATDLRWYVDTILQMVAIAGNFVSDDIWHRSVQIITNNEDLQKYAAETMFSALIPASVHETTVKVLPPSLFTHLPYPPLLTYPPPSSARLLHPRRVRISDR
jgi:AP-2 complex subunit alpha